MKNTLLAAVVLSLCLACSTPKSTFRSLASNECEPVYLKALENRGHSKVDIKEATYLNPSAGIFVFLDNNRRESLWLVEDSKGRKQAESRIIAEMMLTTSVEYKIDGSIKLPNVAPLGIDLGIALPLAVIRDAKAGAGLALNEFARGVGVDPDKHTQKVKSIAEKVVQFNDSGALCPNGDSVILYAKLKSMIFDSL